MKDPILEEVRRAKRARFEEWRRDPKAYEERAEREFYENNELGPDGRWHPKPRNPPLDPLTAALWDADTFPRVARRIRRRKILARFAKERFENARRMLAEQQQKQEPKKD